MGEVVKFGKDDTREPTMTGPAKCVSCKHKWAAVSPIGVTTDLECPNCGAMKGIRETLVSVPDGSELWTCNCGCDAFRVAGENGKFLAMFCINCGASQDF